MSRLPANEDPIGCLNLANIGVTAFSRRAGSKSARALFHPPFANQHVRTRWHVAHYAPTINSCGPFLVVRPYLNQERPRIEGYGRNRLPGPTEARYLAFLETITTLRPGLHRYCAHMMGSVLDGEDLVQEAFFQAYRKLEALDTRAARWPLGDSGLPTADASISAQCMVETTVLVRSAPNCGTKSARTSCMLGEPALGSTSRFLRS
jgi:hypothetical protein